jgi:hypothetical protein
MMMGIAVTAVRAAVMSVKNAITHVRQINASAAQWPFDVAR